jgi:hypothetical protein
MEVKNLENILKRSIKPDTPLFGRRQDDFLEMDIFKI